ncbi:Serine-protein kinase RsbW [hydrothermal vent metagenome]|uniref:Serine-protein kinase RsbW n=1 Tax=hydrothermal vent metagenome TaxID=652676 RepID=A0A3B0RU23_9ZZZZ
MTARDTDHSFTITTPGTEEAVREALALVRDKMRARELSEDICGNVEIALAEALNNIVEHAYADITGTVEISGEIKKQRLLLDLRDHGRPMPDLALPKCTLPDHEVALEDLPEGGFGWFLIHSLTMKLLYNRMADGNCLTMVFSLNDTATQDYMHSDKT